MRHSNVWAGGLALGLGLCVVGIALGQEPDAGGNWFTRLFSRSTTAPAAAKKDEKKDEKREEKAVAAPVPPSPAKTQGQARADLLRRLEVCDKLRQIAADNGDTDLMQKADQLEQRASDAYAQRMNRGSGGTGSLDEDTLQRHLAPKAGASPSPTGWTAAPKTKNGAAQASVEDRK
jgi:hypothetical protein